jgi:hypothetical protein
MKLAIPSALVTLAMIVLIGSGCEKDYKNITPAPAPVAPTASWTEGFSDHAGLGARGWVITNLTDKPGQEAWRKGRFESTNTYTLGVDYMVGFPAYSAERSPHDFMSVDMYAGALVANMSVWLITPVTKIKNGDVLTFYTRSRLDNGSFFFKDGNDRMQVRANYNNASSNVGNSWTSVGDFTTLMLDINSGLALDGYPQEWTKYTLTVSGVTGTINGRFAFRYFIPQGGPDGNNAGLIGVDEVVFTSK